MVKAKSAIPEGFRSLTPYLIVDSAKNFLEFIRNAFGASEKFLMRDKTGAIRHAEARIGDSIIEFAEAGPGWSAMPAGLHHYVKNSDEAYARALKAGGTSLYEPANRDYGDREAGVRDPAGNFWFIATHTAGKSYRPEILQELNTYFSVKDAGCFLDFLQKAFGAEVIQKEVSSNCTIQHAKVRIGDTVVELSEGRTPWDPGPWRSTTTWKTATQFLRVGWPTAARSCSLWPISFTATGPDHCSMAGEITGILQVIWKT